jgi:putative ABC transport system permease protein
MTAVALKGLWGRKTRSILTGLAILLGVAMISGTYVLTDTVQRGFETAFSTAFRNSSAVITAKNTLNGSTNSPSVPASLLTRVRALPGVSAAAGADLFDSVELVGRDGKAISSGGAPNFGFGVDPRDVRFNPISLVSGHWANGPHQVVIDSNTAASYHYRVGETIGAKGNGRLASYTIVGIGKISGISIGGATLAIFDVPTERAILDQPGFDEISVAAKPGVSPTRVVGEIRPLLPSTVQVKTSRVQTRDYATATVKGTSLLADILLVFAGVALFVGGFVIFNTISITVAQRTRELATLRTIGASRRQVLRSVLLESLVIGLVASVAGLFFGLVLAKGLNAAFVALGLGLPQGGTVFATRTIVVSLVVGTLVTLLAGLFPAIRATRVAPISAVREGAAAVSLRMTRRRAIIASVVLVLGLTLVINGMLASGGVSSALLELGAGTMLLFIGVALLSSSLVRPLARVVGYPARRFGGAAGKLAAGNAVRNPARTAATAAALMIGVAFVAFVATLGAGARSSLTDGLRQQVKSDYVLAPSSSGSKFFSPLAGSALSTVPGVTAVSGIQADRARTLGGTTGVGAVDPATIATVFHFTWRHGADSALANLGDGALVDSKYASDHHLAIGSPITLQTSAGNSRRFVVRATYRLPEIDPLLPSVVISQAEFDRTFPQPQDQEVFVDVRGGANSATTARLQHALANYPDTTIQTTPMWIKSQGQKVNQILDLFYVLLALAVIVSLFGMVNTLVLAVFERTRELGMLRAIGMSRRQTRRLIRHESIITALIGAALGLPLGVFLAGLATRGLSSSGIGFHLPVPQLIAFLFVAVLAGIVAAVLPARRAAGLNVLQALQYE